MRRIKIHTHSLTVVTADKMLHGKKIMAQMSPHILHRQIHTAPLGFGNKKVKRFIKHIPGVPRRNPASYAQRGRPPRHRTGKKIDRFHSRLRAIADTTKRCFNIFLTELLLQNDIIPLANDLRYRQSCGCRGAVPYF